MDYCAGVWGYRKHSSCSHIQNRALRYVLGVHQKAPILALEGDMRLITSDVRRQTEMLWLWNRLIHMDDSRLTRKVFLYDYNLYKENWCYEMKLIFGKVEQLDVFNNNRSCNIEQMKKTNVVNDEWKTNLYIKPKLRRYSILLFYLDITYNNLILIYNVVQTMDDETNNILCTTRDIGHT